MQFGGGGGGPKLRLAVYHFTILIVIKKSFVFLDSTSRFWQSHVAVIKKPTKARYPIVLRHYPPTHLASVG